jgi:hypothetical protein
MDHFLSTEYRRVKRALKAWKTNLLDRPDDLTEHNATEPLEPVGNPVLIGPFEEVQVLRRTRVNEEKMTLVSWHNKLHLVVDGELDHKSVQLFGPIRPNTLW